jgi:hypothetical protein
MLYTDIPSSAELAQLVDARAETCVSIYLPTHAITSAVEKDVIVYKNLVRDALSQLRDAGVDKRTVAAVEEELESAAGDEDLWPHLSESLGVLATPETVHTFRLPLALQPEVQVSDRFHLKPLLAAQSQSGGYFVLALSHGSVRLIEATSTSAAEIKVPNLPKDISKALGKNLPKDRAPAGRIQGSEGDKVLFQQYCRIIDRALRPVLTGRHEPLVLASVDYLAPIFRAASAYGHIADDVISGSPDRLSPQELRKQAEPIIAAQRSQSIKQAEERFKSLTGTGKASDDIDVVARAAANGLVDTLLVDLERPVYGLLDLSTGAVSRADGPGPDSYDITDKAAVLTATHGGTVLALDKTELPSDSPAAAIFRYPL